MLLLSGNRQQKSRDLKFGVSEHLGASYTWFQAAHLSDKQGQKQVFLMMVQILIFSDLYHASYHT